METAAAVDWSDLPNDIVYKISTKTEHLSDYIRFGAVCKSWRSAISSNPGPPPLHLGFPFLFLSSKKNSRDDHALYSPLERKVRPVRLPPRPRTERCIGSSSSDGWICMVDDNLDIYLFNPFSNAAVVLPPLRTDIIHDPRPHPYRDGSLEFSLQRESGRVRETVGEHLRDEYTYKAVWSAEPTDPNCIILLLLQNAVLYLEEDAFQMAYCRVGDARWTMIKTSFNFIADAVFYKEDHRFYVVGYTFENIRVVAIDVILQEQEIEMPELEEAIETEMASDPNFAIRLYLAVGGPSGLVVVLRLLKFFKKEKIPYDFTAGFKLFKLDETETKWVVTKSLDDDGDGTVFLGSNNSMWLSSRDFKGLCRGNSIYFTDDDRFYSTHYAGLGGESGVFHLEDGSFGSIYGDNDLLRYLYPHPVWVLPNP